jgi:hypothetical protein
MRKAHSKDGRWSNLNMDIIDLLWVIMPFCNTVAALSNIFISPLRYPNQNKKSYNFNKLFRVKK